MTAPTWRHDCGHEATGLIPRPCPGCGQHGSWIAGGTQVVAQTAPPARLAFVAGDPRPPTRMAWHDPAPSLAEKARADVAVDGLTPPDGTQVGGFTIRASGGKLRILDTSLDSTSTAGNVSVAVPPAEYAAMLAVVQAAREWSKSWHATGNENPEAPKRMHRLLDAVDALPAEEAATSAHRYLSTGCLHGEHDYCSATTTDSGAAKQPARCKFCPSPCVCPCHAGEAHDGR